MYSAVSLTLPARLADIVKMVESEPELAARIRRVRGGYLKIQGTWMPYEVRSSRFSRPMVCYLNQPGCSETFSQVHTFKFFLMYASIAEADKGCVEHPL